MPMVYAQHDNDLKNNVTLQLPTGDKVKFQFPPRITSDNRRGNWKEGELPGIEPVAVYATSGAREITLEWTYMVDGGSWGVTAVSQQVKQIRGYFAYNIGATALAAHLVVKFRMWALGGTGIMSGRLKSVTVKHSPTLVGSGTSVYPLRTDISVDLRLWTKAGTSLAGMAADEIVKVDGLNGILDKSWY